MITLIWDLDGTLIDSYPIIVDTIQQTIKKYNLSYTNEEIFDYVITYTVVDFLKKIADDLGISLDIIKHEYSEIVNSQESNFVSLPYAKEVLEKLDKFGVRNFLYTHKGKNTKETLESNDIYKYFEEIVTSENNFLRKPDPEALEYLINKYTLDKENTYYVGDRSIDVDCAINANINSIYYGNRTSVSNRATHTIKNLKEIFKIIDIKL